MTAGELVKYYAKLLILQYVGLPRAFDTIRATAKPIVMPVKGPSFEISFSSVPTAGDWSLLVNDVEVDLHFNSTASDIQTALHSASGLVTVVTGDFDVGFTVSFPDSTDIVDLELNASALMVGDFLVNVTVDGTDQTLPIAVQNAFDPATAVGVQLDVIGKYQGVTRDGNDFDGNPISLDDDDFRSLIQFAIIRNNAGSSLAQIQALLQQFFPGEIFVFDYQNMHMSYLIDSNVGSQDLVQLLVNEGLLPKPMGVQLATTIYNPDLKFFGMLSASVVKTYADQNGLTINQAADELLVAQDIWQFNSVAAPIVGQWLSAAMGVV